MLTQKNRYARMASECGSPPKGSFDVEDIVPLCSVQAHQSGVDCLSVVAGPTHSSGLCSCGLMAMTFIVMAYVVMAFIVTQV